MAWYWVNMCHKMTPPRCLRHIFTSVNHEIGSSDLSPHHKVSEICGKVVKSAVSLNLQ